MRGASTPSRSLALALGLSIGLCLGWSAPAYADCGGSSSGGSSGGGSSGGGSSSSSGGSSSCDYDDDSGYSGSSTAPPRCISTSRTVGFDECRRYGQGWSFGGQVPVQFFLSPFAQRLVLTDVSFDGSASHEDNRYYYSQGGRALDQSELLIGGLSLGGTVLLADIVYIGAELQIGGGPSPGPSRSFGEGTFTPEDLVLFGGGGLVGAGLGLGDFTLRAEILVGGRATILSGTSEVGPCTDRSSAMVAQGIVEPRAAAEVFVLPNLSLGAYFGANLVIPGEMHGGLSLRWHSRSFDGISGR